ncbi:MAG: hypothetical protein ACI83I_001613 [Bacteroidia bacterium]|jgi:hypothetical protein
MRTKAASRFCINFFKRDANWLVLSFCKVDEPSSNVLYTLPVSSVPFSFYVCKESNNVFNSPLVTVSLLLINDLNSWSSLSLYLLLILSSIAKYYILRTNILTGLLFKSIISPSSTSSKTRASAKISPRI